MICWLAKTKFLRAALGFALLVTSCHAIKAAGETPPLISFTRVQQPTLPSAAPQHLPVDQKVMTAALQPPPASAKATRAVKPAERTQQNHRVLAPPTRQQVAASTTTRPASTPRPPAFGLPKIESLATASAGLAIVVGLFLVCMWLLRRSGPKPTSPLPSEAVAVLGRVPLAAQNFAHLLQVGNKLVLVAITPDGVAPITEITDPAEVQRLIGLCLRNHKQSTTAEFHDVLQQLAKEPASGFLGNEVAAAYSSQTRSLRT